MILMDAATVSSYRLYATCHPNSTFVREDTVVIIFFIFADDDFENNTAAVHVSS